MQIEENTQSAGADQAAAQNDAGTEAPTAADVVETAQSTSTANDGADQAGPEAVNGERSAEPSEAKTVFDKVKALAHHLELLPSELAAEFKRLFAELESKL